MESRIGTRFGPYELRSLLGKGGMGEVYEAYDTVKDRVVAVKLLPLDLAKDPQYQQRFRRESQAAARLAEPHVIPIHDWGQIDGVLYIDMRLVRGHDLKSVLRRQGPMPAARAIGIVEQIAAALDAAHAEGLVHRDVKPANILVTASDFAYLADFGIARSEGDPSVTATGAAIGSYSYIAPERFDTAPVTGTADVYSLACVLYECLTGTEPFPSDGMSMLIRSHLSTPPPRPSVKMAGLPGTLDEVVSRGMAKEPQDRYPTAGGLAAAARASLSIRSSESPTEQLTARRKAPPTVVFHAVDPQPSGQNMRPPMRPPQGRPDSARVERHRPASDPVRPGAGRPEPHKPMPVRQETVVPVVNRQAPVRLEHGRPMPVHQETKRSEQIWVDPGRVDAASEEPTRRITGLASLPPPSQRTAEQAPARRGRSKRPVVLAGILIALALIALVGWQVRDQFTGQAPTTPTPVQLPAGAKPCPQVYPVLGKFSSSAVGTTATTCPFAEEVRKAYAEGPADAPPNRTLTAHSPISNDDYKMECTAHERFVSCNGGQNALVYVY
ncbi:protein kinase [Nocardia sp. NPDC052566]|uniref:serine/threonine-protein kinase n=1 Tax=Nocardia sp. NPDC052566 TaxID=3364330 RepID=UPI0037C53002